MFNISEELKKLPPSPGCYIMKDDGGRIIYVGKAINLRNRVRQYFQNSAAHTAKVLSMVEHIAEFEYIVTDNELEALILENSLIKTNAPKYNILLKDDKAYPYLKITTDESYPRVLFSRRHEKVKAKYFGPYSSAGTLRETIELIHQLWPLRRCPKKFPQDIGKGRPCLNYHIGRCKAPCEGLVSEAEYDAMIAEVIQFLNGKYEAVEKKLEAEMLAYAETLEFEKAAETRDKLAAVKSLGEKQKIEGAATGDTDVIAACEALVQVFFIRGGKITGREHFMLDGADGLSRGEILSGFIKQFYGETSYVPKEILLETEIPDAYVVAEWLSGLKGQKVEPVVPQRGEKLKLVQMAAKNAAISFEQFGERMKRERERTSGALDEIREALGLDEPLFRAEAYDISNIQGYESVGSMVVFENGRPKPNDYRKFKIKAVVGADDYASMEEVITRRFKRFIDGDEKFSTKPDILMIDGGAGQVHSAETALASLGLFIPVCGMVKDDRHRTRGLMFYNEEITLPRNSEGFKLLTRIQDEVHRFAIEYHRKLREKSQIHSVLDDVPGIGAVRRKALLKHFGAIEKIQEASADELALAEGMNKRAAEAVYKFFHSLPIR